MLWPTLAITLLGMTALIALYLAGRAFWGGKIQAGTRYAIGLILAAGLLIPIRPPLPISFWTLPEGGSILMEETAQSPSIYGNAKSLQAEPRNFSAAQRQDRSVDPTSLAPAQAVGRPAVSPAVLLATIWLTGVLCSLALLCIRQGKFSRLIRRWRTPPTQEETALYQAECGRLSIRRPPGLYHAAFVNSPLLIGLIRPVILIPRGSTPPEELRLILRHELCHHRRHDLWCKALALGATVLHWFNPLAYCLARAISTDCEMACDDAVLKGASAPERKQYVKTILKGLNARQSPSATLSTYFYERSNDMQKRFASMLRPCPAKRGTPLVLAILLTTLCAGAGFSTGTADNLSLTTGLPTDKPYRPVLAVIDNSESARPPLNLSEADIVYEGLIWTPDHTRYVAVYNDNHPNLIGGLRGARVYQTELRQAWDAPLVHWGGQGVDGTSIYDYYDAHLVQPDFRWDALTFQGSKFEAFGRVKDRVSPHNAVANLAMLVENEWPKDPETGEPYTPRASGLSFSDTPTQGKTSAATISFDYDTLLYESNAVGADYRPMYTYNQKTRLYERWYNGMEQIDGQTGERIVASNVLIQYCAFDLYEQNSARPLMELVGEGPLDAFIDGLRIRGTWARKTADSQTEYFDENGDPLLLMPGKTFIQLVPPEVVLSIEAEDGTWYASTADLSQ